MSLRINFLGEVNLLPQTWSFTVTLIINSDVNNGGKEGKIKDHNWGIRGHKKKGQAPCVTELKCSNFKYIFHIQYNFYYSLGEPPLCQKVKNNMVDYETYSCTSI